MENFFSGAPDAAGRPRASGNIPIFRRAGNYAITGEPTGGVTRPHGVSTRPVRSKVWGSLHRLRP